MMMATMPSTTTTAGLAPLRVSTLVSREANWPPVDACSTHEDQASPACSSSDGSSTPTAEVAAMTTSPEPTSMSGFALRVSAIRAARDDHAEHGDGDGEREDPLLELADGRARRPGPATAPAPTR